MAKQRSLVLFLTDLQHLSGATAWELTAHHMLLIPPSQCWTNVLAGMWGCSVGNYDFQMRAKISASYKEFQKAREFLILVLQPNSCFGIATYLAVVLYIRASSYFVYQMLCGTMSLLLLEVTEFCLSLVNHGHNLYFAVFIFVLVQSIWGKMH